MMDIDRIARHYTDVEPSPDLEARIRTRLDQVAPRGKDSAWWLWRVGAPAGAAIAAAVVAIAVVQSPESRVQSPEFRGLPTEAPSAKVSAESKIQSPESRVQPTRTITSRLSKIPTSTLSSEELAWMDRRIPALEAINSLQLDRLSADSIQPEALAITPLTMTMLPADGGSTARQNR